MTPITIVSIAIVLVLAHAGHTAIASGERLFRAILRRCFGHAIREAGKSGGVLRL